MILGITSFGIVVLFVLNYCLFFLENRNSEKNNSESKSLKGKKSRKLIIIKKYFRSENFLRTIIDLLVIILGATIAINFSEFQEKRHDKEQIATLLNLARQQIENEIMANEVSIEIYEESSNDLDELKYNMSYDISVIELILNNSDVLNTLTPYTISSLLSLKRNTDRFYKSIIEANHTDNNIPIYVKGLISQLQDMEKVIGFEIDYLEGKTSIKSIEERTQELIFSKYLSGH